MGSESLATRFGGERSCRLALIFIDRRASRWNISGYVLPSFIRISSLCERVPIGKAMVTSESSVSMGISICFKHFARCLTEIACS